MGIEVEEAIDFLISLTRYNRYKSIIITEAHNHPNCQTIIPVISIEKIIM